MPTNINTTESIKKERETFEFQNAWIVYIKHNDPRNRTNGLAVTNYKGEHYGRYIGIHPNDRDILLSRPNQDNPIGFRIYIDEDLYGDDEHVITHSKKIPIITGDLGKYILV